MRRLVVDLRHNGGGLLDQALMIAMHFLPRDALIASTLGRARATTDFRVPGIGAFTELGLSVLVNGSTAAGAEVLAGALQDHRRAVVVGTPTFGRASIQSMHRLRGGGYLSLTTARWTRPVSGSVHPGGIRPDVAIDAPLCEAVRGGQGDVQLQRAVQALRDSR
jgi:carboxyl-terminal processing protease